MEPIGTRIRNRRKSLDLSQQELSVRAGVTLSLVSKIEQGRIRDLHLSTLEGISRALDTSVSELIGEPEPAVPLGEAPAGSGRTEAIESPYRGLKPIPTGDPSPEMQAERLRERAGYVRFLAEKFRRLLAIIAKEEDDSEDRHNLALVVTLGVAGVAEKLDRQGVLQILSEVLSTRERGVAVPDELREAALNLHEALGDLRKVGPQAVRVSRGESPESVIDAEQPKGEIHRFPTRSVEEEMSKVLEEAPYPLGDVGA